MTDEEWRSLGERSDGWNILTFLWTTCSISQMVELKETVCGVGHLADYVPAHLRVHLVYKESVHAASLRAATTTSFFFFSFLEGLMWSTVFVRWIRHNEAVHKDVIQHTKLHSFVAQSDISYLGLNSFLVIFLLHKSIVVWHRNIICVYFVGEVQVVSLSIQFLWCSD